MTVSESLRREIERSGITRYRIAQDTGIAESQLSRFISGQVGLRQETIDKLAAYLGLELRPRGKRPRKGR